MTGKDFIVDPSALDFDHIVAGIEEIRKVNPQRFAMEQLTAIILEDLARRICVGFKDVTDDEFWVRGHMPGMPLMPGVVICEAAAQLCSYFAVRHDLLGTKIVGFGGMEEVRFRGPVVPGDRLVVACQQIRLRRGRAIVCRFQAFVHETVVADGTIMGVPLPVDALERQLQERS